MQSVLLVCILLQAIYFGTADGNIKYDQDGGIISVLLKKVSELEERDREFETKLEEIGVLKERLDEAQRRLTYMQELEYRLQKAEEQIQMLVHGVGDNNTDYNVTKSDTKKAFHPSETHDNMTIDSSGPVWILREVSNLKSRQSEMGDKIKELVSFKNRIQTVQNMTARKDIKRAVTRKAAFTATFSYNPVTITPGHPLAFDRVDYNEGSAYDTKFGVFTCPVSGTYFFFTNVLSYPHSGQVRTELVVEGLEKGSTSVFSEANFDQGVTAAIIHCIAGQRVWVRVAAGSQVFGPLFSSFSGILLWPSDDSVNSN